MGSVSHGQRGPLVDMQYAVDNSDFITTAVIPSDDTIPQNTEGLALPGLDVMVTPKSRASLLRFSLLVPMASSTAIADLAAAVFRDNGADAIGCGYYLNHSFNHVNMINVLGQVVAGSLDPTTFKVRVGISGGTMTVNRHNQGRIYGGAGQITLEVEEYLPVDYARRVLPIRPRAGRVASYYTDTNTYSSLVSSVPIDDTVPQITEGAEVLTNTIKPKKPGNLLRIRTGGPRTSNIVRSMSMALFRNSDADAISALDTTTSGNQHLQMQNLRHYYTVQPADLAGITFSVRCSCDPGGTSYLNGRAAGRDLGGAQSAWMVIDEFECCP